MFPQSKVFNKRMDALWKNSIRQTRKTQQAGFKINFRDNANTDTTLLDIANMPSLHDRRVQDMSILIYKVIHGTTPTPLRTLLTLRSKSRNLYNPESSPPSMD